jgi:hypothetical protein
MEGGDERAGVRRSSSVRPSVLVSIRAMLVLCERRRLRSGGRFSKKLLNSERVRRAATFARGTGRASLGRIMSEMGYKGRHKGGRQASRNRRLKK